MNTVIQRPLADETMSSWAWRVFNENTHHSEKIELHNAFYATKTLDPDFNFSTPFSYVLQKISGMNALELKSFFSIGGSIVLPRLARYSYCYRCMEDSIKNVGLPFWRKSWCCVFNPVCDRHGVMLLDGNSYDAEDYNAPGLMFITHANTQFPKRGKNLAIQFSEQWYGKRYIDAALNAFRFYSNMPDNSLSSQSTSLKRLWKYVYVALTVCHCARFGGRVESAMKHGMRMPSGRKDGGLVIQSLANSLYAATSTRTEALFYCGVVFGVFEIGPYGVESFGYAPMDSLILGRLVRREKPRVADWLVTRLSPNAHILHPATEQFLIGLNIEPASYGSRF